AIWPRVTKSSGQNRVFEGGLQPRVIPAFASHSMSASNGLPSSSPKRSTADGVFDGGLGVSGVPGSGSGPGAGGFGGGTVGVGVGLGLGVGPGAGSGSGGG